MTWIFWALLSTIFAAATAILAKLSVVSIDSNLATVIRTSTILVFTWGIVAATYKPNELAKVTSRGWLFLIFRHLYWIVVALLFPGPSVGAGFKGRPHRQAKRRLRDHA